MNAVKKINIDELIKPKSREGVEFDLIKRLNESKTSVFIGFLFIDDSIFIERDHWREEKTFKTFLEIALEYFPDNVYRGSASDKEFFWVFEGPEKRMLKKATDFGKAVDVAPINIELHPGYISLTQGISEWKKNQNFSIVKQLCESNISLSMLRRPRLRYQGDNLVFFNGFSQNDPDSFMQIAKSQLRPFFFFLDKKWYGSDFGKTFLGPVLFALVVFIPVFGVFELYKLIERLWNHAEIFWGRSVWNLLSFTTPGLVYVFKIWWFFLSCGIGVTCYEWLDRKIHQSSKLGHNNSWWICLTPRIFGVFIFILLMLFFASFGEFLKIFGNE